MFEEIDITPIPTSTDLYSFFNLIYAPVIARKRNLDYKLIITWFQMRIILLSTYILHNRKLCYFCKNSSDDNITFLGKDVILSFEHSWTKVISNEFDDIDNLTSFLYNKNGKTYNYDIDYSTAFTICSKCKEKKSFTSTSSYCKKKGLNHNSCLLKLTKKIDPNVIVKTSNGRLFLPLKILQSIKRIQKNNYQILQ